MQKAGPLGSTTPTPQPSSNPTNTPPATTSTATNPHLTSIASQLAAAAAAGGGDAFTQYLAGVVALDLGQVTKGQALLVESLAQFPCNWGAWQVRRWRVQCGCACV